MTVVADQWFVTQVRRPQAPVQLFCLPYAGAGAGVYAAWPESLGIDVELSALMLPGRERRWAEPPEIDPVQTAAAVLARADRPYALFGHSMGARLAFEVARELRRNGNVLPMRLLVSGCLPPDEPRDRGDPYDGWSELDYDELLGRLAAGGGVPPEILAEPELLNLLLPTLRADLGWLDRYHYRDEPPLPIPVTGFAGDTDPSAQPSRMDGWRRQTTAGFTLRVIAGGHFFLNDRLAELCGLIRADLTAADHGRYTAEEDRRGR
jgi:surfactin synthase thioesterase subunit